jgi:hypothetical protein
MDKGEEAKDKDEEVSTLEMILEYLFIGYEKAAKKFRENYPQNKETAKEKMRMFCKVLAGLFIAGVALIAIGIASDSGIILVVGRLILLPVLFVLFAIAALPAIAFESIGAKRLTGEKYTTFVRHFFAYQLFLNLILMAPWVIVSYQLYFYLMVLTFTLTFLTAWTSEIIWLKFTTSGIMIFAIGCLLVPGVAKKLSRFTGDFNRSAGEARLMRFTINDLLADEVPFYADGKPAAWLCVDDEKRYILYRDEDYCQNNGKKMKPITEAIKLDLKKYRERIISSKNIIVFGDNSQPKIAEANEPGIVKRPTAAEEEKLRKEKSDLTDKLARGDYQPSHILRPENFPPIPGQPETPYVVPKVPKALPPPTKQTRAPEASPATQDNRKEYVVLAMDSNVSQNNSIENAMVKWLGPERAVNAYNYLGVANVNNGTVNPGDRQTLSQVAKKIICVTYEFGPPRNGGGTQNCSAYVSVKVIDAASGNVIRQINQNSRANDPDFQAGSRKALGIALQEMRNRFQQEL